MEVVQFVVLQVLTLRSARTERAELVEHNPAEDVGNVEACMRECRRKDWHVPYACLAVSRMVV